MDCNYHSHEKNEVLRLFEDTKCATEESQKSMRLSLIRGNVNQAVANAFQTLPV